MQSKTINRRSLLKQLGIGAMAGSAGLAFPTAANAASYERATRGLPPLKITNVKAIATSPHGIELIVVKVETSEPGLYGIGCATFRQRAHAVVAAIDKYLNDFCKGRDVDNIEDIWQATYQSSYWRNGPVLNNALSGLDQALWDIKGKRANMPVYQLLGGKCRFAVDCYGHASGNGRRTKLLKACRDLWIEGFRHVRIQMGGYGASQLLGGYGDNQTPVEPDFKQAGFGMPDDNFMDSGRLHQKRAGHV